MGPTMRGSVVSFDGPRGVGAVVAEAPVDVGTTGPTAGPFPFHCVSIADGTRSIERDQAVTFVVRPGRGGQWEAIDVSPVD